MTTRSRTWPSSRALLLAFGSAFCTVASSQSQIPRLEPAGDAIEVVEKSELISGNAATGIMLVQPTDSIGSDRLWAYLSDPIPSALNLEISTVDGRYYAKMAYAAPQQAGWVPVDLGRLKDFGFLERTYKDPLNEVAALLSEADGSRFFPLRWGRPTVPPQPPADTDPLRVYMNTERATAFVVVGGSPAYCRDASSTSGFKFNAICDVSLGDLRRTEPDTGRHVVDAIEVFRRAGVRTLAPLTLDVLIKY